MGAVYFYHLTDSTLEQALPPLLSKAAQVGWRVEVRAPDAETVARLDRDLWLAGDDSFLPHGRAGGPHDDRQPVLLTTPGQRAANGAVCIMSVGGVALDLHEIEASARACILFDGADQAMLDAARAQWRTLTGAGCTAQYWAQEGGRWVMKQER